MGKITKTNIQTIIKKPKTKMVMLIIISLFCSIYSIIDYISLIPFSESSKTIGTYEYNVFGFMPGDAIISSFEYMVFYMVLPIVSFFIFMSLIFDLNRRNKNEMQ